MILMWVVIFLLAAAMGSFANVLVYRLPLMVLHEEAEHVSEVHTEKLNIAVPASHCPACQKKLRWWHNIPLLGFILLRGRCGFCDTVISWRYFIIEFVVVLFALYCVWQFGFSLSALAWFVFLYILWVLAWIDAAHFLLPDNLTYTLLWIGLLWRVSCEPALLVESIYGVVFGYLILRAVYEIHFFMTSRQGLGMGDMKLLAAIGAWLGLVNVPNVLMIACIAALLFAVFARVKHRAMMIPFGPFLAFGALSVLVVTMYLKKSG